MNKIEVGRGDSLKRGRREISLVPISWRTERKIVKPVTPVSFRKRGINTIRTTAERIRTKRSEGAAPPRAVTVGEWETTEGEVKDGGAC